MLYQCTINKTIPKGHSFPTPKLTKSIKVPRALFFYHIIEHNHAISHSNKNLIKLHKTHPNTLQTHTKAPIGIGSKNCKFKINPVNNFLAMDTSNTKNRVSTFFE